MAQDYHHGVRVIEINSGSRPIRTVSTSVVGLIATAEDADAATFPLDTPVLITDVVSALGKAGTKGTLYQALNAIGQQTKPVTIVVRVAEGADDAATTTNVIGTVTADGKYTGAKALLAAQAKLGVKPRILGAPFLDTQPVTAELASIAQTLRAFVYAFASGCKTKEEVTTYRKQFSQREVMVIWPNFLAWDATTSTTVEVPAVAYAMGLRAKIDNDTGWHKTLSNVGVNGVTGISADVSWDLQDPSTDAGYLNEQDVTTLINKNGFRFGLTHLFRRRPVRVRELHAHRAGDRRFDRRRADGQRRRPAQSLAAARHHREHQRHVSRLDLAGLSHRRLVVVGPGAEHDGRAQVGQGVHRLRLHARSAARKPDASAAHHGPLPCRLRDARERVTPAYPRRYTLWHCRAN